jgi:acyl-coenzyme A thioesterase PaaI-like protein
MAVADFQTKQPSPTMARTVSALRRALKALYHVHPQHDDEAIASTAEQLTEALIAAGTLPLGQESDIRYTRSPITGSMNPIAPPAEYTYGENSVTGKVRFHEGYQGPPACVHGGYVSALFDDVLGRTRHLTGRNCVTGSLSISYKRPTPLNADLEVVATIQEILERKFIVTGELTHQGEVLATAEGIFVFRDTEKFNALVSEARDASR